MFAVSDEWSKDPSAIRVRYEGLVHDTKSTLAAIVDVLDRPECDIDTVISECSLERLKPTAPNRHFWKGEPNLWKKLISRSVANQIYNAHTAIFDGLHYNIEGSTELTDDQIDKLWSMLTDKAACEALSSRPSRAA